MHITVTLPDEYGPVLQAKAAKDSTTIAAMLQVVVLRYVDAIRAELGQDQESRLRKRWEKATTGEREVAIAALPKEG